MEPLIILYIIGFVITLFFVGCAALAVAINGDDEEKTATARYFFFSPLWPLIWGYLVGKASIWVVHWANIPELIDSLKVK